MPLHADRTNKISNGKILDNSTKEYLLLLFVRPEAMEEHRTDLVSATEITMESNLDNELRQERLREIARKHPGRDIGVSLVFPYEAPMKWGHTWMAETSFGAVGHAAWHNCRWPSPKLSSTQQYIQRRFYVCG